MKKNNTKDIALLAVMLSLMLIFALFPINIGAVEMAFMALFPIIVVTQVRGLKLGLILSAAFGIVSFIVSFQARSLLSPVFQNPLVSIVPRLFIGLTTYYSCKFAGFLLSRFKKLNAKVADSIKYGVSGAVGVCTNTALVLGMMLLLYYNNDINGINIGWALILAILGSNFVIELIVITILCIPVSLAINKMLRINTVVKIETKDIKEVEKENE